MPSDTDVELEGLVVDVLPGGTFKVEVVPTKAIVLAYLSGRMRTHAIRVVLGDRVLIAVSPYDLTRGRVTKRL
jgi:translation initiation factor IF-1